MIRRLLLILLIITNVFSVSGCWDQHELSNLTLLTGVAVESSSEGGYRVIAQTINPSAASTSMGGGGVDFQKAYRNTVAEGDSVHEAFNNLKSITAARAFLSHTTVIIISEDMARERGVREVMDYLERAPQIRLDPWVIIGRGNLINLMDEPGRISLIPTLRIQQIIELPGKNNSYAPLQLGEFIRLMQNDSSQPYTAGVEIKPNMAVPDEAGHEFLDGNIPEPLNEVSVNSTALFRQDRLMGWLNREESCGLLLSRGHVKEGFFSFDDPEEPGKKVGTTIVNNKSKIEPDLQNGEIFITINIEVETFLEEVQGKPDLEKTVVLSRLEKAQGEYVKKEVQDALKKAQEYKADVFGFGEAVHRNYPEEWKKLKPEWPEIFSNVQVDIQVKSTIRSTSMISKAAEPGKN